MKCPICARETDPDAMFCTVCGKRIPRCPSCGRVLYERGRFCDHDGTPLSEELFAEFPPEPAAVQAAEPAPSERPAEGRAAPPPAAPPPKKRGKGPLAAVLILLAVLLLAAAGAGGYYLLRGELPFLSGEKQDNAPDPSGDGGRSESEEDGPAEEDDPVEDALAPARELAEEGDWAGALEEIRRALEENPRSQKLQEALEEYIEAFEEEALERAAAAEERDGLPAAVRSLREAMEALGGESERLSGKIETYGERCAADAIAQADRLAEGKRLDEAKAGLDEALALFPENEALRGALAQVEALIEAADSIPPISMDAVTGVEASSYLKEPKHNLYHTADRAIDGDLSAAWVEGAPGDGIGESITFTFDGVYRVSGMHIHAGYQKSAELYQRNARPAVLTVTFSDGGEQTVTLQDVNGVQDVSFDAPAETESVTLTIASVYPGSKFEDTVISEVAFY